jgi:hypothetical protein
MDYFSRKSLRSVPPPRAHARGRLGQRSRLVKVDFAFSLVKTQYSQRHTMINHCDRLITHLGDTDIYFVLFNIPSKFLLYFECYLLSPKMHKKVSKRTHIIFTSWSWCNLVVKAIFALYPKSQALKNYSGNIRSVPPPRAHARGRLGQRSHLVKVDFAFSLVKTIVQVHHCFLLLSEIKVSLTHYGLLFKKITFKILNR